MSKYVHQYVDDKLSAAPDFPRYLAFARQLRQTSNRPEGVHGILRYMLGHSDLLQSLPIKFRFGLSVETEMLVVFFEDDSHYGSKKRLPKSLALSEKVMQSKLPGQLSKVIRDSEWASYIDLDAVGYALKFKAPNDPKLDVPYEIVRNLLKEGLPQ